MKRPLLPILLGYAGGIWLGSRLPFRPCHAPFLFLLLVVFLALSLGALRWGRGWRSSLALLVGSFLLLGLLRSEEKAPHGTLFSELHEGERVNLEGVVAGPVEVMGEGVRFPLEVTAIHPFRGAETWETAPPRPVTARIRVTVGTCAGDLRYGDRIRLIIAPHPPRPPRVPGAYDARPALARAGIEMVAFLPDDRGIVRLARGAGNPILHLLAGVRREIRARLALLPPAQQDLLRALLLGETGGIEPELRAAYAATGTAHLLAVSGLHVGVVAGFVLFLVRLLLNRSQWILLTFDREKIAAFVALVAIFLYALLTGMKPPVLRASVMIGAFLSARLLERRTDRWNTLALAAFLILLSHPTLLFSPSFQLSFGAVGGILHLMPGWQQAIEAWGAGEREAPGRIRRVLLRVGRWGATMLALSLAATLGTTPFVAWHFHQTAPMGILLNLFAVPLVTLIVPVGVAGIMVLFSPWLSSVLFALAGKLVVLLIYFVSWGATLPGTGITLPPLPWHADLLFALGVLWLPGLWRFRLRQGLLLLLLAGEALFLWLRPIPQLEVVFLDVGQGDAIVVRSGGKTLLIDGGGDPGGHFDPGKWVVAPYLRAEGIRRLDAVVLSHPHPDHFGGLPYILEHFEVGAFWVTREGNEGIEAYLDPLSEVLERKGIPRRILDATVPPFRFGAATIEVLWPPAALPPPEDLGKASGDRVNNGSLVLRIGSEGEWVLLPGDIEREVETRLLASGAEVQAAILKVPHHGSSTSTTRPFLEAVDPGVAVIPVGWRNRFRFPHPSVRENLDRAGVQTYRTDRDGTVTLHLEADGWKVERFGRGERR